jgi:Transposase and inactivated derivatives
MFGWGSATRIYLAAGATDMRKNFDGLYGLVRDRLELDPLSGHVFLFSNAQRNRMKVIYWDGSGLWVCAKRLERGCFRWPAAEAGQTKIVLSHEEMALLVGGIDLAGSRRRAWFRKIAGEETQAQKVSPDKT